MSLNGIKAFFSKKNNKICLIILSVLLIIYFLGEPLIMNLIVNSCPDVLVTLLGTNDWTFELSNNYEIVNFGGTDNVRLMKHDGVDYLNIIGKNVKRFAYHEEIVVIQQEIIGEKELLYFIVNTENDVIYKNLSKEEFDSKILQISNVNSFNWIDTDKAPLGVVY